MLNINPDQLKNLAESQLKGHRTIIYLVALLLLIGGLSVLLIRLYLGSYSVLSLAWCY